MFITDETENARRSSPIVRKQDEDSNERTHQVFVSSSSVVAGSPKRNNPVTCFNNFNDRATKLLKSAGKRNHHWCTYN